MSLDPGALPTTLGGQFKRHLGAYVAGGVMLGVFQLALNRIDWLSKAAIDDVFGGAPEQVTGPALWMFGLAVLAFASRVGSRWGATPSTSSARSCSTACTASARRSTGRCPPARS